MNLLNTFKRSNDLYDRQFKWPEMGPQDWLLEILSIVGLVGVFIYTAYYFRRLPEVIPVNFDAQGSPGDTGSRLTIWIIPAICLLINVLLPKGVRQFGLVSSPRFLKRVFTQNQFNGRIRLLRYNKTVLTWGLFYLTASSIRITLHSGNGIGDWFIPVFLAALILPMLYYRVFIR